VQKRWPWFPPWHPQIIVRPVIDRRGIAAPRPL
jgi:hypothetical protein